MHDVVRGLPRSHFGLLRVNEVAAHTLIILIDLTHLIVVPVVVLVVTIVIKEGTGRLILLVVASDAAIATELHVHAVGLLAIAHAATHEVEILAVSDRIVWHHWVLGLAVLVVQHIL